MQSRKVVLTTFASPIEAQIARTQLEDAEIWCLVADDGIVATDPLLAIAVGGVRVLVFEEDVPRAMEVLAGPRDGSVITPEFEDFDDDDGDEDVDSELTGTHLSCPSCGSDRIGFANSVYAYWALTGLVGLVAVFSPAGAEWEAARAVAAPALTAMFFIGMWATILRRAPVACEECGEAGPRSKFENRL